MGEEGFIITIGPEERGVMMAFAFLGIRGLWVPGIINFIYHAFYSSNSPKSLKKLMSDNL